MAEAKILVVEDERIVAKDIENRLTSLGYEVVDVVARGDVAVERANTLHPDLVLMDIHIKGDLDGIESAKKIREGLDIPIVFLTAYSDDKTLNRAVGSEPHGYIVKPFEERELRTAIQVALHNATVERKLRESEQWLSTTLSSIGDAVIATDAAGKVKFMNPRAEQVTGCRSEDTIGKAFSTIFNIINETTREACACPISKVLKEGLSVGLENGTLLITKSGGEVPIEDSAAPIFDGQGNAAGVVLVFRDVTKQRAQTRALKNGEERFRLLAETAQDAIVTIDESGTISFVNSAVNRMFGYTEDQVLGAALTELIPERLRTRHLESLGRYISTGKRNIPWTGMETIGSRRDGTEFPLEISFGVYKQDDKHVFTGFIRDITARKKAQEELAAEKKLLALTLASITDGVITTDMAGKITMINAAAEQLTGRLRAEVVGASIESLVQLVNDRTGEAIDDLTQSAIQEVKAVHRADDIMLVARDESRRLIAATAAPIIDHEGVPIGSILIINDITEKKKLEQELIKAHKLESIGVLAGGIAHDFNNILAGVMGNISLIKLDTDPADKRYNYLAGAEAAALRAKSLTQQLLTFAKGGTPITELISVADIITAAATFALHGSSSTCAKSISQDLWAVKADKGQIDQVINNLIINADQAMPQGGPISIVAKNTEIKARTTLPIEPGPYVKISVIDEGIGITNEDLKRIFDPYFSTKSAGTGLGLAICYSIIRSHRGHIDVTSELNVGTTVAVYLPATPKKPPQRPATEHLPVSGTGRILVMDDDQVVRETLEAVLKRLGYSVDTVVTGDEAILKFETALQDGQEYNLVILDLTVRGGLGGKDTIAALLQLDKGVRAVATSGYSTDRVMSNFDEFGFKDVIIKPYRVEDVSSVVARVMAMP